MHKPVDGAEALAREVLMENMLAKPWGGPDALELFWRDARVTTDEAVAAMLTHSAALVAENERLEGELAKRNPVRVDPDATAVRARIVREALNAAGQDAETRNPHSVAAIQCFELARYGDDETLAKLGRLLK